MARQKKFVFEFFKMYNCSHCDIFREKVLTELIRDKWVMRTFQIDIIRVGKQETKTEINTYIIDKVFPDMTDKINKYGGYPYLYLRPFNSRDGEEFPKNIVRDFNGVKVW